MGKNHKKIYKEQFNWIKFFYTGMVKDVKSFYRQLFRMQKPVDSIALFRIIILYYINKLVFINKYSRF